MYRDSVNFYIPMSNNRSGGEKRLKASLKVEVKLKRERRKD